ncbi:ammonium transporter [Brucepastera parasyntrophica]|uniref:ammonium transporter n=1 Tax=Brucepastera parasyntrophica TaxID=2880008 RepID=UPI00210878E7|nr:ammonium transporter [Brucepastera parasyntrophica]ULQ60583.1 ammonium transporter [Brucepastera parasyntrophica]
MDLIDIVQKIDMMWVILGGVLVFFMQLGFALVETGFTRSKNSVNIIMKNLMDFSLGTVAYYVVGFGLMFGSSFAGFMGISGFFRPETLKVDVFESLSPGVFIFFQTMFAATAATIVSGAMAERTKFKAYIVYSIVISLCIYPISGHWIWGGGWLSKIGFIDFAGSTAVHSVGGWAALTGAALLGPRIGKYGPDGKINAIPGHNLPLGATGVFILWMGWFGFNPGSTLAVTPEIGYIAMTTNLAAAVAAIVTMFLTWFRYGKPDLSMTLNGALAGLVAITAGCQVVTFYGAIAIGFVAGILIVFGVEFFDRILKVDDPVGATSVHLLCGIWGTLAVGLFARYGEGSDAIRGLFYGGGFALLGVQVLGVIAVGAWVLLTTGIMFFLIKKTIGLRVPAEEEKAGLDLTEHGNSAYPEWGIDKNIQ